MTSYMNAFLQLSVVCVFPPPDFLTRLRLRVKSSALFPQDPFQLEGLCISACAHAQPLIPSQRQSGKASLFFAAGKNKPQRSLSTRHPGQQQGQAISAVHFPSTGCCSFSEWGTVSPPWAVVGKYTQIATVMSVHTFSDSVSCMHTFSCSITLWKVVKLKRLGRKEGQNRSNFFMRSGAQLS